MEKFSENYRRQLKSLHETDSHFGTGGSTEKHYARIDAIVQKKQYESVLDYGCGKGHFVSHVRKKFPNIRVAGYDIANENYSNLPDYPSDLTVCLDVLEHVEFGSLGAVLTEIRDKTLAAFLCSVSNRPAHKNLPDGRNAHITQLPFGFWFTLLSQHFRVDQFVRTDRSEALFVCAPLDSDDDWR